MGENKFINSGDLFKKFGIDFESELPFLFDINFVNNTYPEYTLTTIGDEYYLAKYCFNNEKEANDILINSLKKYAPVNIMCKVLYGKPNLKKEHLIRTIRHFRYKIRDKDFNSLLTLLNKLKILKYSKKTGRIEILLYVENEVIGKDESRYYVHPNKPFSNVTKLRECIRVCDDYLWWFEKHFTRKILEELLYEIDGAKIKEVKLLFGNANINHKVRKDFKKFKSELEKNDNIICRFKVILDKNILNSIHGRWIISKNYCFNIPPTNTILKGQADEISRTTNLPSFEDWWSYGLDIVSNWNEIQKYLENEKRLT